MRVAKQNQLLDIRMHKQKKAEQVEQIKYFVRNTGNGEKEVKENKNDSLQDIILIYESESWILTSNMKRTCRLLI